MTENGVGRVFVFKCHGCLDGNGASPEEVVRHAINQGARFFIIDASEAAYVDTPGVRWLLRLRSLLESMGKSLRLVAESKGTVSRNLQMLEVDIDRFDTLETAWRTPWGSAHSVHVAKKRAAEKQAA